MTSAAAATLNPAVPLVPGNSPVGALVPSSAPALISPATRFGWRARPFADTGAGVRALVIVSALLVLAGANLLANRVIEPWMYIPFNLGIAGMLLLLARGAGLTHADIGIGRGQWKRAIAVGLLVVAAIVTVYAIGMVLPATSGLFVSQKAHGYGTGQLLYDVLLRIPLGTVLIEEIAFRGVLPALFGAAPAVLWRWRAVLATSALFGLWHIIPALGMNENFAAVGALGSGVWLTVALTVVGTAIAGAAFCLLVRLGRGIGTMILFHWALNAVGLLAAWIVTH